MTPPFEPMLLFIIVASSLFVLPWLLWGDSLEDDGVELQYDESREITDAAATERPGRRP
jgi:hypothetical protein